MPYVIEIDGKRYEVPPDVESAGPDAVSAWLAKQQKAPATNKEK